MKYVLYIYLVCIHFYFVLFEVYMAFVIILFDLLLIYCIQDKWMRTVQHVQSLLLLVPLTPAYTRFFLMPKEQNWALAGVQQDSPFV